MSSIDVFNATCPACGKVGGHKVNLPVDAATSWECECGHWWEVTVEVEGIANVAHKTGQPSEDL